MAVDKRSVALGEVQVRPARNAVAVSPTAMLAAISHDLRTPLTRIRLRGKLIEDEVQQARLFRDVDELQTMVGGALAFFRGAFTNLIENAVKYGTPPTSELTCRETTIAIMVRDQGPGIPSEALDRVFSPFYRLESSRDRTTGGVGLGLTAALAGTAAISSCPISPPAD